MIYKILGKSGLRVSELALGTMTFGTEWGWGVDQETSKGIFDAYANSGGNFIDTANRYTGGTSEKFVGEFVHGDRDHFVLATKYTLKMREGDPNYAGNHRKNMMQSVHASLKRLNTDFIDLLWLHAWDFVTPIDEVMRGLDDLIRQGVVHYVGISDTPAWVVSMANTMAELRGWSRFIALQIRYSLADRAAERDLLPMARALDIAVTPWSVLGAGVLTGKYNDDPNTKGRASRWEVKQRDRNLAGVVKDIALELGVKPSQVAIAWVLSRQKPNLPPIIPILGATSTGQLMENMESLPVHMDDEQLARLEAASAIELGFPHDFLAEDGVRDLVYSGVYHQIHNHRSG